MALDVAGLFAAVESHASTLGVFERVNTSEPKSPPGKGLSCAIWVAAVTPVAAASGLDSVSTLVLMMLRILKPMLQQPYGQIDPDLLTATDVVMAAYSGSFTLDGHVRNVDLLGAHGMPMAGRSGYVTIDKQMFRIMDISLPLIINDLWNEVA